MVFSFVSCDDEAAEKPKTPEGKAISNLEGLKAAVAEGGKYYLDADISITEEEETVLTKDLEIDLNNKELNVFAFTLDKNDAGYTVKITNGTINSSYTNHSFKLRTKANLILDNVTLNGYCIFTEKLNTDTSVQILNSKFNCKDYFGITTNATVDENGVVSSGIRYLIKKSFITTAGVNGGDNVAVLVNVGDEVVIEDSELESDRQVVIVRGTNATINNSTLKIVNPYTGDNPKDWQSGSDVPSGALIIGNNSETTYQKDSNVKISGEVKLIVPEGYTEIYMMGRPTYSASLNTKEANNFNAKVEVGNATKVSINDEDITDAKEYSIQNSVLAK